jgi:flagellar motor switch protein FliN
MSNLENFDIKSQVVEAIIEVFDTMFSATLEHTDSVTSESLEGVRNVGSVSFDGDVTGMVSIHFSEMFAREMAAKKLGDETDEIGGDEEVREMLGEVGNFVGDNLKSSFTEAGLTCVLSPPSFTTGTDFEIEALNMEAGQPGNDIHYSVNEGGEEEQVTPANEEVQPETEAGEAESVSETATPPEIDAALAEANAPESQEPPSSPPPAPQEGQSPPEAPESRPCEDVDLDLLLDIPLEIKVELGRAKIQIQELLNLAPGSAVKLIKLEGEPVDILANETLIARGEVVVQKEKYGIRVTEITSRLDRIRSFGL